MQYDPPSPQEMEADYFADYGHEDEDDDAADPNHEPTICGSCNGSGEGMFDGARCYACKGCGEL